MTLHARIAEPEGEPAGTLLCVHGFPESSWMWRHVLEAAAQAGWRAVAPDMPGSGDSAPDRPQTWERLVDALDAFVSLRGIERPVLCTHDWGTLIGLRWVAERNPAIRGLVISDSGFFPDGRWHGLAQALRTPGEGEELIEDFHPDMMRAITSRLTEQDIAQYAKGLATEDHRLGHLEMYRSADFEKIDGQLERIAELDVPALLVWGADDPFAPVAGAHRFAAELPRTRLEILEGVGHFVFDDRPAETAALVADFLGELAQTSG